MPSSHSTDPETPPPQLSHGALGAGKDIGSPQELLPLVNALKDSHADPLDTAQQKAEQLAKEIDAVLRNPQESAAPASTIDRAENTGDDLVAATVQEYAASLTELQKRFDALVFEHSETRRERDDLARQLASADVDPRSEEMEKSLHSIRQARDTVLARNVALSERLTAAEGRIAELEDELERSERARDAALSLSGQLSQACDELRQATLELTRERDQLHEQVTSLTKASGEHGSTAEPLNPVQTSVALAALQTGIERLTADPGNRGIFDELEHHFHSLGEQARAESCVALDRLSAACEQLTGWLRKTPGKIAENIAPLANAVGLLGRIVAIDGSDRITDPTDAVVYCLDDDVDNCECITMAMGKIALKVRYATKPQIALNDLTAGVCDLIILDVDLPEMNGLDLFALVRALGHHERTPFIILNGVSESEARTLELRDNAQVFMRKPYNLNTLGLTALCMILKARLTEIEEGPSRGRSAKRRPRLKAQSA